ncbi:hypothetical protein ENHYD8BJ_130247 [Enhydrobacter sp. 8BJ]|nr:hypothetical protein ENHYD8BJ_130247 [Enhydrobacter sp. 8BJ]
MVINFLYKLIRALFIQALSQMLTNDEQTRLTAIIANNLWVQKSYHEHNSHKKSNQR